MHSDRISFLREATGEPHPLIHSFVSFITCWLPSSTVFLSFFQPLFFVFFHPLLHGFVFSRKAPTCFVMCVRPSVRMYQLESNRADFREMWYLKICPGNPNVVKIGHKYTVPKVCLYWEQYETFVALKQCTWNPLFLVIDQLNVQILVLK